MGRRTHGERHRGAPHTWEATPWGPGGSTTPTPHGWTGGDTPRLDDADTPRPRAGAIRNQVRDVI
ncbi:MAG: hypothetical protein KBI47_14475, partial [Armatimonadetes bacterium]|nr:hypothetical protein [Armatimonadota bacterium]